MVDRILEAMQKEAGDVTSRGLQLARELQPTAIDVLTGNPHSLSEWLIFIFLFPIIIPINFIIWSIRWIMTEAPLLVNQIKKITGLQRTSPLGHLLDECLPSDSPLGLIADALISPVNEFDLGIMEAATGQAASAGIGAMLDPFTRSITFCMNRIMLNNIISTGQAAALYHKGFMSQDQAVSIMANYGYSGTASTEILRETREPPDLMSILTLINRGHIDFNTGFSWIRQTGTDEDFTSQVIKLREFVPNIGEIAGFMSAYAYSSDVRGEFGLDDEFPTESLGPASRNGASEGEARNLWLTHWSFPSVSSFADMMYRGLIVEQEAKEGLRLNGIPPRLRQPLLDSQQSLFTQRYIRNLYKYGIIDYQELVGSYMKLGFNQDRAVKMANLAVKMINPISQSEIANTLKEAYKDGLVDYQTTGQALMAAGHSEYETELILAIADHSKGGDILKEVESYVKAAFLNGDMSLDEGMNYLDQYGITAERKDVLKLLWSENLAKTIKHVSEGDARKAYNIGLINGSQLRGFLEMLRYTEDDISVIIAIENATMTKPQDNIIAPITSASGKAKSFTKAELKNMLVDGIIDANTWYLEMQSLGYTDAQIQAYLMLIEAKAKTTTGAS